MKSQSFHIKSYGCQMNVYDSQKICSFLKKEGLSENDNVDDADIVVFNTCNIRDKAAHKVYSDIGRVSKRNNEKIIAVVGCVAQAENHEIFNKSKEVDIVLGPQSYHLLPKMLKDIKNKDKQINTEFIINEKFDYLVEESQTKGVSSFITIQEGCDKFCSFCVVPYTRGPEYSRSILDIKKEVIAMTDKGTKEIILLGQNVNAFEHTINQKSDHLSDLINEISKIEKIIRIRYTTSHPNNMSDDLILLHGENNKLMPFLHLPVQSGSNAILKKMNRKYTSESYKNIIFKLRKNNSQMQISSDFIVGFPGETEEDFNNTLNLVDDIKFTQSYSFIYSERPGTKASSIKDETSILVKKERLKILQDKLKSIQLRFNQGLCNEKLKVLIENQSNSNSEYFFGRTPYMQPVYIKSKNLIPGMEVEVKINSCNHKSLYASY